ncbi:MAG: acetyl-CoA carboxylase biotin carboxyl carrier protein subunit [Rhodoplanes sp.]|uniref:acetyl-CoA carboxylase biotin carboxyl carrier protein subunit n=1 Tax=Rhodoplanes sp. TaxID=1968906 RepID=UPI0018544EE5|nr:acetyl-CoA carboxylase biotin carboxyl carrier protein subunit [Rhodoplanes sp.]NVO17611.1 acetyl-CoA carboxylase biotin carboxyl carrier protein subunit [Rhodoplanes sp.]
MAEEVRAPLAGIVQSVLVEPGATVEADDELVVVATGAAEHLVYAPCAGAILAVRVQEKDAVAAGDVLLLID